MSDIQSKFQEFAVRFKRLSDDLADALALPMKEGLSAFSSCLLQLVELLGEDMTYVEPKRQQPFYRALEAKAKRKGLR